MKISLSDHFNVNKLLRFTLPSIIMMIVSSIYGIVDGFFVSNFVGKTPFTSVNFIMPFLMVLGTVGFMFGTGGSALVAKTFGEGDSERAKRIFSLLIYVSMILGVVLAVLGITLVRPVAHLLGARGEMLENCVIYARVVLLGLPAFILQMEFQSFFVTAERPNLGLYVTVGAGITNMVLDWLFVGVLTWGLVGAAAATAISQAVGGFLPLLYFARKNSSILKLGKTKFDGKALLKTCTNGSSEFMSNISMSLVGMLYNAQLLSYAGEDGVAAYGVLMYVSMIFCGVFIGYSIGSAPVIGFHYGAGNYGELKGLLKRSVGIIAVFSVLMVGLSFLLSAPLSSLFVGYDKDLFELTKQGFNIFSLSFLFMGMAIFGSGFFTALNDGLTSAAISFLRTVVFQVAAVLIFPLLWGIDGIWWSIVAAEFAAVAVFVIFLFVKKKKYHYM